KPFVANETAVIRVYRGKKKIRVKTLKFTSVANNTAGVASIKIKSALPGTLTIKVSHKATPAATTARAKTIHVQAVRPSASFGSSGPAVRWLQGKLASLHYVTSTGGSYDAATGRAVMAFRKLTGMSRTNVATEDVFKGLLAGKGVFKVRHPGD